MASSICLSAAILLSLVVTSVPLQAQLSSDIEADWLEAEDWSDGASESGLDVRGFLDFGIGSFIRDSVTEHSNSLAEARGQLNFSGYLGESYINAKFELLADAVADNGLTIKTRELYVDTRWSDRLSIRLGQQVLTWGTGDFVFLNDYFPKDWQAMFSGRDDQYLKAASKSLKVSYQNTWFDSDTVWTPEFESDRYIDGERFGFFNPATGRVSASPRIAAEQPKTKLSNGQLALRFSKTSGSVEYALYGYRGFYTQPVAYRLADQVNYFPRLNSYGASLRRPLSGGLFNIEISHLSSLEDKLGLNPYLPNSQWKFLVGHERELGRNLTAAMQLYIEKIDNYSAFKGGLSQISTQIIANKWHSNITFRLTYLSHEESVTWSLFGFYSPDKRDFYIKPKLSYRHDDHWLVVLGGNIFGGDETQQWGQFGRSSNLFARLKYSF